jgi:hypothetical protein
MPQHSSNSDSIVRRGPSPAAAGLIASGLIAICAIAALIITSLLDRLLILSFQTEAGTVMFDALQRGILGLGDHAAEKMFAVTMAIMMVSVFFSIWRTAR